MAFSTTINCMDGRVQIPVIEYMKKRFGSEYVDVITEPGPILILSKYPDSQLADSIFSRLKISVERHKSGAISIVGHHDCAGNPAEKDEQVRQITEAKNLVGKKYRGIEIIGLWVDKNWEVHELEGIEK